MRGATIWVLLAGCGTVTPQRHAPVMPASTPASPVMHVPPSATSTSTPTPGPVERLAARGVYHDDFVRPVLYTWTTPAQVAALRDTRRLLVAEAGAGVGPSPFLRALAGVAERRAGGHALAASLLEHPSLRRRRYAWTSPFATTMGLGPVRYGDALIRVELDPRAIVLRFRPGDDEPFAAFDMQGAAVAVADVEPGRIGAVYHVRDGPRDEVAFREYVLCNESMVAAWSVVTPEIRAQVDADIALLTALAGGPLVALPDAALRSSAAPAWAHAPAVARPIDLWHASLAFDNTRYRPSPRQLAEIVAALRGYDGAGAPLRHTAQVSQTSR